MSLPIKPKQKTATVRATGWIMKGLGILAAGYLLTDLTGDVRIPMIVAVCLTVPLTRRAKTALSGLLGGAVIGGAVGLAIVANLAERTVGHPDVIPAQVLWWMYASLCPNISAAAAGAAGCQAVVTALAPVRTPVMDAGELARTYIPAGMIICGLTGGLLAYLQQRRRQWLKQDYDRQWDSFNERHD